MQVVNFHIEDDTLSRLNKLSKKTEINRSRLIRKAINQFLGVSQ